MGETAVEDRTEERDQLKDVVPLVEEIQRLRKILGYKPRRFPDVIPLEMVPELEEERDGLLDECEDRKKKAADLLDKIGKLWRLLDIPRSDRPNLALKKKRSTFNTMAR